jgi:molybdopterin converting factor small subunit
MEELQSTEILDREILEDARKKAWRILKTADETVQSKTSEWEKKTAATVDELARNFAGQRKLAAAEIMARLPVDKRRVKVEKIENMLQSAVKDWYAALGRERILNLLKNELAVRLASTDELTGCDIHAVIHNLERGEAEAILRTVLHGVAFTIEAAAAACDFPEIILETKKLRVTASIQKTVEFFLQEKRAELVEALLGGSFAGEC